MIQNKENIYKIMKILEKDISSKIRHILFLRQYDRAERLSAELEGFRVAIALFEDKKYFDRCVKIFGLEDNNG